jgi:hypothetical protein
MSFKSISKIVVGVCITILLGAIGSGVWENILSPGLDWTYRAAVDLVSTVSLDYKNRIYEKASMGFHEDFSFRLFSLVTMLLPLLLMFLGANKFSQLFNVFKGIIDTSSIKFQLVMQVLIFSFAFFALYANARNEAIQKTRSYSLISLDILHPYVGGERFIQLKSEFLQVKTSEEFYSFNKVIVHEAKINALAIPEFDPI